MHSTLEQKSQSKEQSSGLEELARELRRAEADESDALLWIVENWRRMVGAVIIAALGWLLVRMYLSGQERKLGVSSENLSSAQKAIDELISDDGLSATDKEAKVKQVEDNLRFIRDSNPNTIYGSLAKVYEAKLVAVRGGSSEDIKGSLSGINFERFLDIKSPERPQKLSRELITEELSAMLYARALLRADSSASQGRALLLGVARGGRLCNVEALLAALRVSSTEAERTEVKDLATAVAVVRPELSPLIREQILSTNTHIAPGVSASLSRSNEAAKLIEEDATDEDSAEE